MKVAVVALLAVVVVLAWLLNAEVATNGQQRIQIAEITTKLSDKTARENLELQEKCALQAKKIFDDPYYKAPDRDKPGGSSQIYQSHYNAKLGKCFMTITNGSLPLCDLCSEWLLDAYERREYASYNKWPTEGKDKMSPPMPPFSCTLTHSSANERECQSYEEFKAFVANYME